jgi:hypothetical protein
MAAFAHASRHADFARSESSVELLSNRAAAAAQGEDTEQARLREIESAVVG